MAEKGGYKPGWQELHKGNLLKLLEVLLSLAEEQLELGESHPPQPVEARWISQTKLLVTGRRKEIRGKTEKLITGTSREDLVQQVTKYGESLKPVERRSAEQENQKIRNVFACLDELGLFKVINDSRENAKYKEFTLEFESRYQEKEDNLKWVEKTWNAHPKTKSPQTDQEVASATDKDIDWHHVCREMLKDQREKQKFRRSITGRELGHEVNVYVPLGLVKPKEQQYKYNEFLQQVIEGQDKNLTITGEPGSGKSTWLDEIALYLDKLKKSFPICIPLESLRGKTLKDYLLQNWLEDARRFISTDALIATPTLDKKLERLFTTGKVWLLLDGVDEMHLGDSESHLQKITDYLTGWIASARVALTCRLNVWEANPNALPNFDTYCTLHF